MWSLLEQLAIGVFFDDPIIIYNLMAQFLYIRVGSVELLHNNGIEESYYSISHKDRQYFTSVFMQNTAPSSDDILILLQDGRPPDALTLQRWENCMMVFDFEVDTSQLRNRRHLRKRIEGRQLQLLTLEMQLYDQHDVFLTDKYVEAISQHYLIVQDLTNTKEMSIVRAHNSLNYFTIKTQSSSFFLPVRSAIIVVKLPNTLQISSFVNSHFNGKSAIIEHSRLKNGQEVQILKDGKCTAKVKLQLKWGVNLHRFRNDQNILVQANQLVLYDFELKFDSPNQVAGCRLKVQHGSKAFEFAQDIDHSKLTKIKKIVYFIIKSQNEEIDLFLHKNNKPFANCRLSSTQLTLNALTIIKKKWQDVNNVGKYYGYIKLRGQRGRNVSIPQSNRYWREAVKRKLSPTNMMISLQQVSVYFSQNQQLALVAKIEGEEKIIKSLNNLNFYTNQDEPSKQILDFSIKGEESLYLIVKADLKSNEFCGIGVLNTTDLRLGINACEVGFFKNQQKAGTINCIIHKIVFWPFIKPVYQPEVSQQPLSPLQLDLFLIKICLTPYFYTFKYDNKRQVYCIVQVNKVKKVLILQNVEHDPLSFAAASGSDILNYAVEQPDLIKIKLTFLVSDLGHEEEIYGLASCKVRAQDLDQKQIKFKNIEIKNDYAVNLGLVSLEVFKGAPPKNFAKSPLQPEKKSIGSFDLSQDSFDTNNAISNKQSPSRRYSGSYINSSKPIIHDFVKKNTHPSKQVKEIKLPIIKEKKDNNQFQDLVQMMKVRKRGHGGNYEDTGNSVKTKIEQKEIRRQRQSYDLKRIEQSNPNLDRNLQILFPKKGNEKQIQMSRSRQIDYDQRLKGLRSVMNEISDIGEVEPSIGESRRDRYEVVNETEERERVNHHERENEPEWDGNEFV